MDALSHQQGAQAPAFVFANSEEEAGFDFWGVLGRRKWLVFLGLVTGMALGGLYNFQAEEVYKSEASVLIEPKNPAIFRITTTDPVAPNNENAAQTRHDRLIGEENILRKALADLMTLPSFDGLSEDEIFEYVQENLEAAPDREEPTKFLLSFYCSHQDDASTVLNNLIQTYNEELDARYIFDSKEYELLLRQVKTLFEGKYAVLQEELESLQSQISAPAVPGALSLHHQKVSDLGKSIEESKERLAAFATDRNRINRALGSTEQEMDDLIWAFVYEGKIATPPRVDVQASTEPLTQQLRLLELQRQELLNRFGASHPRVKSVNQQMDLIKKMIAEMQNSDVQTVGVSPQVALSRYLTSVNQQIQSEKDVIRSTSETLEKHYVEATRFDDIQRKIVSKQAEIDDVNDMMKSIQQKTVEVAPDGELGSTRHEGYRFNILQSASYGEIVWPILPLILGIGGLVGALCGFGVGCLVELADKTFHNPDEIMKQLSIPLIGHVPVIVQNKRHLVENSQIKPTVCTYHRPKSQVSEAFRAVRTALYFNTQGKQHSVIQVTSPTPGDGKSTLSANLAVSIAQSGKRVLLVDADMRRPQQAPTFGITAKEGFATVLGGQTQWREALVECEEIDGLTLMPAGTKPNNPAELSSSPQVKDLIEEMREEFDFIIIDTPPLLAVTDACPIAARVDGVIMCMRIKKNVRVSAERATEMLQNLGANCLGLVVNGVGAQSGYGSQYTYGAYRAGYSYNGYGYGYGYGYGAGKYYEDENSQPKRSVTPKHIEMVE